MPNLFCTLPFSQPSWNTGTYELVTSGYSRAMESIDLEMGDIFDNEAVTVGDGELPPPLPEMDTEDAAPGDGDRAEGDAAGQPSSNKP